MNNTKKVKIVDGIRRFYYKGKVCLVREVIATGNGIKGCVTIKNGFEFYLINNNSNFTDIEKRNILHRLLKRKKLNKFVYGNEVMEFIGE